MAHALDRPTPTGHLGHWLYVPRVAPGEQRRPADIPASSISVLIVCNVRLYREGLAYSLGHHASGRVRVVGTAADGDGALSRVRELAPALVLLDLALPRSVATIRAIVGQAPDTRVVVLAINESDTDVIAIAEAGVSGYLPRDGSLEDLVAAIERAARGEVLCPPSIVASLFKRMAMLAHAHPAVSALSGLTPREQEVVGLIGQGLSNKEIARRLTIRPATVKNHVHNILEKLGVARRSAVTALVHTRAVREAEDLSA